MKKGYWILSAFILAGLCGCSSRNLPEWFRSEQSEENGNEEDQ
jgi:hypothetical protein